MSTTFNVTSSIISSSNPAPTARTRVVAPGFANGWEDDSFSEIKQFHARVKKVRSTALPPIPEVEEANSTVIEQGIQGHHSLEELEIRSSAVSIVTLFLILYRLSMLIDNLFSHLTLTLILILIRTLILTHPPPHHLHPLPSLLLLPLSPGAMSTLIQRRRSSRIYTSLLSIIPMLISELGRRTTSPSPHSTPLYFPHPHACQR